MLNFNTSVIELENNIQNSSIRIVLLLNVVNSPSSLTVAAILTQGVGGGLAIKIFLINHNIVDVQHGLDKMNCVYCAL